MQGSRGSAGPPGPDIAPLAAPVGPGRAPAHGSPDRPRRLLVIHNPAAGRRSARRLRSVLDELALLGATVVLRRTAAPGDAATFARAAGSAEFDAVVAAGGDGTINEVVNGLADSDLALAILPLGTANVLAREIGLPRDPVQLARIAAFAAARPVWLGEVAAGAAAPRRFVMMAGIGFDAAVVAGIAPPLKRRLGKLAFVVEIAAQLARHRACRYGVNGAGEDHAPAALVLANGRFYGGGFVLAPAARLDERSLQLVLFLRTGRLAVLRYMLAMAFGRVHRLSDVRIVATASVTVTGPPGAPLHADGEIVATLPATVAIAARPLWLIQPAAASG